MQKIRNHRGRFMRISGSYIAVSLLLAAKPYLCDMPLRRRAYLTDLHVYRELVVTLDPTQNYWPILIAPIPGTILYVA